MEYKYWNLKSEQFANGNITRVGPGNYRGKALENDFISAVEKLGWPELPDNNTLDSIDGSMRAQRYVGPDGKRQDTAHAYIHPKLESGEFPNLHVLVETDVDRVIFDDNKKAVGVAFRPSADSQPEADQKAAPRIVNARQQVVLSAGALGTPQILERSGVGKPEVLSSAQVPLVASVPGVGENYMVSYDLNQEAFSNPQLTKLPLFRTTTSCSILTRLVSVHTRQWMGFSQAVSMLRI